MTRHGMLVTLVLTIGFAGCERQKSELLPSASERASEAIKKNTAVEKKAVNQEAISFEDPMQRTEEKLKSFYESILSDDESIRLQAIATIEPSSEDFTFLFGTEDGAKLWSEYEKFVSMMRRHSDELKAEISKSGAAIHIEVIEIPLIEANDYFRNSSASLPVGLHAFRTHVRSENGGAGGGNYYHFADRVVFIREPTLSKIVRQLFGSK